jgi:glycosyltransferase involved in cell wall biosynthesis
MRILKVMPGMDGGGGAEQSFAAVAPHLTRAGFQVHLALLTDRQDLAFRLERSGVVVHDLSGARTLPRRVVAIRRLVRQLQPALVHATLWEATLPTQLAMLDRRVPLLVTWANTTYSKERRGQPGPAAWRLWVLQCLEALLDHATAAKFHAVTQGVAAVGAEALHVPSDRIFVAERGRSAPPRALSAVERDELRASLGIEPHQQVVLTIGRQEHQKAHSRLVDEFAPVARATSAVLLIAGREGAASSDLAAAVERSGVEPSIKVLGYRSDARDLLAIADVFVLASTHEGAAGSVIEAMAAGTPIVATQVRGLVGVLEDGVNALVVRPDGIGDALLRLLARPELGRDLSGRARQVYEDRFTEERSADALADVYRAVARPASKA